GGVLAAVRVARRRGALRPEPACGRQEGRQRRCFHFLGGGGASGPRRARGRRRQPGCPDRRPAFAPGRAPSEQHPGRPLSPRNRKSFEKRKREQEVKERRARRQEAKRAARELKATAPTSDAAQSEAQPAESEASSSE